MVAIIVPAILIGLHYMGYLIVKPFVISFAWAVIVGIATYPWYLKFRRYGGRCARYAAPIIVIMFALVTVVLLAIISNQLVRELAHGLELLQANSEKIGEGVRGVIAKIPVIGNKLLAFAVDLPNQIGAAVDLLLHNHSKITAVLSFAARNTLAMVMHFVLVLCFVLFLYERGGDLAERLLSAAHRFAPKNGELILRNIHAIIRGAVYGSLLTALVQGILLTIAFCIVGLPAPILFGLITALFSFIPIGPPAIYIPAAIYLYFVGSPLWALFLIVWGIVLISGADNILRPIFISKNSDLSMGLVFIGVIGGIFAFGLIGLFIGPAIMATLQTLWGEFFKLKEVQHE